jgi:hypothetical protein
MWSELSIIFLPIASAPISLSLGERSGERIWRYHEITLTPTLSHWEKRNRDLRRCT